MHKLLRLASVYYCVCINVRGMSVCLFVCLSVCLSCMMATTCSRRTGLSDSIRASERVSLAGAVWSALLSVCGTREENGRPCNVESSIHGCGWPVHPDRPASTSSVSGRRTAAYPDPRSDPKSRYAFLVSNVETAALFLDPLPFCVISAAKAKQIPRTVNTRRQKANGQYHCCILANITEK